MIFTCTLAIIKIGWFGEKFNNLIKIGWSEIWVVVVTQKDFYFKTTRDMPQQNSRYFALFRHKIQRYLRFVFLCFKDKIDTKIFSNEIAWFFKFRKNGKSVEGKIHCGNKSLWFDEYIEYVIEKFREVFNFDNSFNFD